MHSQSVCHSPHSPISLNPSIIILRLSLVSGSRHRPARSHRPGLAPHHHLPDAALRCALPWVGVRDRGSVQRTYVDDGPTDRPNRRKRAKHALRFPTRCSVNQSTTTPTPPFSSRSLVHLILFSFIRLVYSPTPHHTTLLPRPCGTHTPTPPHESARGWRRSTAAPP